ncbi:AAA family ATPase [Gottschalkiaceae bacterium SANA]|nr:AAA family ATPase [Gottschalkiaceae bacterium SANA]
MHISKLTIKNYRNFGAKEFEIPLRPATLIIGENNIGKSNLIEAIGLVISQDITMFKKRTLDIEDINFKTKLDFKKNISALTKGIEDFSGVAFPEVKVEIVLENMSEEQLAAVGDWFFEKSLTKVKITYLFRPRSRFDKAKWINEQIGSLEKLKEKFKDGEYKPHDYVDFPIEQYEYIIFGGDNESNKCDQYYLRMLKYEVLDALRDAKKQLVANSDYKLLYRILTQNYENDFSDIKSTLETLNSNIQENDKLMKISNDITEYLKKVLLSGPESDDVINFSFSAPEVNEVLKKLSLVYGRDPISIERNGLGKNNLLYISIVLSHLTSKMDDKNELIFRVIGIEEPEAHLHPHLQKHLSNSIKEIGKIQDDDGESEVKTQLLMTSHSTHIATSVNIEDIVILYRDNSALEYHYITTGFGEKVKDLKHLMYLKKYLDATNSCMFYARRIILVEGISEQILVPALFNMHTGKTLESMGISIINVNGVAFKHFLEVVKNGYFIKCGVITDKDAGKITENRAPKLREEYDDCKVIKVEFNDNTFEKAILEANKTEKERTVLLDTYKLVRPNLAKLKTKGWTKEIIIDDYFADIEEHKSDFAFYLEEQLVNEGKSIKIPEYIKSIFNFVKE